MKAADLVKRLDELLEHGNDVLMTQFNVGERHPILHVKSPAMVAFRSVCLSFIERVYGQFHPHFVEFKASTNGNYLSDAERAIAFLKAIRNEISGGWLFTFKGLVASELFSDFLEMAEHLLTTGYKDPSAVMAGSVLEEHLRQLCLKHKLDVEETKNEKIIPLKADRLNANLAKAEVYTKLDQKQITAWLDLRNSAAHGKYEEYTADQVRHLLGGVTEFMVRISL